MSEEKTFSDLTNRTALTAADVLVGYRDGAADGEKDSRYPAASVIATEAEAEAGDVNDKLMTPLRTSQHTDAAATAAWADPKLTIDGRGRRVVFAEVDGDVDEIEFVNASVGQLFRLVVKNTSASQITVNLDSGTITGATLTGADDVAVGAGDREQIEVLLIGGE